jgi:hypothetical protein
MSYLKNMTALSLLSRRMGNFTATTALVLAICPALSAYAESQDKSVIGQWKLTKVLDSSEITALDDDGAQQLVGRVISIEPDKVRFGKRTCMDPDFEVTIAETDAYFARHAHASAEKLGLPNPVTAVHINCTYVYKKSADKIVVHWKGYFFDAVRFHASRR